MFSEAIRRLSVVGQRYGTFAHQLLESTEVSFLGSNTKQTGALIYCLQLLKSLLPLPALVLPLRARKKNVLR
jgi:hypothetical protein